MALAKPSWDDVLFFLVRHGKTPSNEDGIYRSWSNRANAQLSADGRQDAREAGRFLTSVQAPVELIIADSLDRTVETAEILAGVLDVKDVQYVRALHPLNMGDLTGESKAENPVEPYLQDRQKRIPGGETVGEFDRRQARVFGRILDVADTLPGGRVLVIGHGSNISFLHNRVFNSGEPRVGYEGLVDPGGVVAATADRGMIPLLRSREERKT